MTALLVYFGAYLAVGFAVVFFAHVRYARVDANDGFLFFVLVLMWPLVFALLCYLWITRSLQASKGREGG